ncbi:MAG: TetR/AcrR family transcriptional regulator [Bdellovibrionales bacterium]|nr:TetR/AcrR family transcriptional regulator [Bdellovibrionales bacterium]
MKKSGLAETVSKEDMECAPKHSRDKLLAAAFEIFSQHGFHGTTTKKIALAAGVNEALIMRHFKSKEGLFLAVIERNLTCEPTEVPYPPQATVEAELICFCNYLLERDRKKSDFLRIVIGHSLQDQKFVCKADEQVMDKRKPILLPRLQDLKAKGLVAKDVNLEEVELILMSQVFASNFFTSLIAIHNEQETRRTVHTAARLLAKACAPS